MLKIFGRSNLQPCDQQALGHLSPPHCPWGHETDLGSCLQAEWQGPGEDPGSRVGSSQLLMSVTGR